MEPLEVNVFWWKPIKMLTYLCLPQEPEVLLEENMILFHIHVLYSTTTMSGGENVVKHNALFWRYSVNMGTLPTHLVSCAHRQVV